MSSPVAGGRRRPERERQVLVGLALFAVFAFAGIGLAAPVAAGLGTLADHRASFLRTVGWLQAGLPWLVIGVLALYAPRAMRSTWLTIVITVWLTSNAIYIPGRGADALRHHFRGHFADGRRLVYGVGVGLLSAVAGMLLMIAVLPLVRRLRPDDEPWRRRVMQYVFLLAPLAGLVLVLTTGPG